jgi:hypothetical protein
MSAQEQTAADSPFASVEHEYFFSALDISGEYPHGIVQEAENNPYEYLRGFLAAAEAITSGLRDGRQPQLKEDEVPILGATWGLIKCRVPPSVHAARGIKVAVLDTGMDLGHPDFAGRSIVSETFVGQPVEDLHSHGTHCIGTACGPDMLPGTTPRYGVGFGSSIFVGKVLTNSGTGVSGSVLAGINWAIANRCEVISMSLGSQSPVQTAYTDAGTVALNNGLLLIAAAGNRGVLTGAPANSPTIMSVASVDSSLSPSSFSNFGKIEIAAPGRDVFSSVPRPTRYGIKSGTSMATPHVAGCAALWAEASLSLRGMNLWRKLQETAMPLQLPATRVGAGLVQAP